MQSPRSSILIGCAGWSLPRAEQARFPEAASHLERYATRFAVTEINSTFHRPHRVATFERWYAAVPDAFRFSAKLPKGITHAKRLQDVDQLVLDFLRDLAPLREKLTCLLVQLPPKLEFDRVTAARFFEHLRASTSARIVCEPRHPSWFDEEADSLLAASEVARVAADPARVPAAAEPGGWRGCTYYRLHGSPVMYRSSYSEEFLAELAEKLRRERGDDREVWCIFDNTTLGAATRNALDLCEILGV